MKQKAINNDDDYKIIADKVVEEFGVECNYEGVKSFMAGDIEIEDFELENRKMQYKYESNL